MGFGAKPLRVLRAAIAGGFDKSVSKEKANESSFAFVCV